MKPTAFPQSIHSSVSSVFLEAISQTVRDQLWHHIQTDRLHPKRKNGWPGISDLASLDAYIASCDVSLPTSAEFAYLIVDRAGSLTGTFHIFSVDWAEESAEIGYGIHHQHEGKGLIAAAIGVVEEALKGMGFKSLRITDGFGAKDMMARSSHSRLTP